jgi:hypothetical protein
MFVKYVSFQMFYMESCFCSTVFIGNITHRHLFYFTCNINVRKCFCLTVLLIICFCNEIYVHNLSMGQDFYTLNKEKS